MPGQVNRRAADPAEQVVQRREHGPERPVVRALDDAEGERRVVPPVRRLGIRRNVDRRNGGIDGGVRIDPADQRQGAPDMKPERRCDRLEDRHLEGRIRCRGSWPGPGDQGRVVLDALERAELQQVVNPGRVLPGNRERVRFGAGHDVEIGLGDGLAQQAVDRVDASLGLIRTRADADLDVGVGDRRRFDEAVQPGLSHSRGVDRSRGEQRGGEEGDQRGRRHDRPVGPRSAQADQPRAEERTHQLPSPRERRGNRGTLPAAGRPRPRLQRRRGTTRWRSRVLQALPGWRVRGRRP